MLHVGIVTRSLMTGGTQQQIVRLSQTFDRRRVKMTIILLINDEARDLVGEVPPDVEVVFSPFPRRSPRVVRWLSRELRRRHVDVVHSFLWSGDATAALSRKLFGGPPLLTSERGDRGITGYSRLRNRFDRLVTFRVSSQAVANSFFGARVLVACGCPERKIRVIPNGIDVQAIDAIPARDLRREFGWSDDVIIVGSVARLIDYKGIDDIVRGMALLVREDPRYRCVFVGDGPQRAELEALAATLGIAEQVRFAGLQRPGIACAKAFDVAVLATRESEHCSNSILEYLACGVPVVATDVAGNTELITNGENGLLVPSKDPEALARAIRGIAGCPERARAMARNGRERIERDHALPLACGRFIDTWSAFAARA